MAFIDDDMNNDQFEDFSEELSVDILENEAELISALLTDDTARSEILSRCDTENFTDAEYRIIFANVKEMKELNLDISTDLVIQKIRRDQEIENKDQVVRKILNAIANYPIIDNLQTHILIQINKSTKVKLDNLAKRILDQKIDYMNSEAYFNDLQEQLMQIINSRNLNQMHMIKDYLAEFNKKLENIKLSKGQLTGTTSGFKALDKITNGFQPSDLIILAARPSIGKTALALNFLINAAKSLDKSKNEVVVMFSLEMGTDQLIQRMICSSIPLKSEVMRNGDWDERTGQLIEYAIQELQEMNILVDDKANVTILDIQASLQQIAKTNRIKLVVIDYLQLIETVGKNTNRVQEVGKISRTLKLLAKELQVPIIAIAQLSRKIEERKGDDRKPMLSDLRESGSIEQDADIVSFIDYKRDDIDETQINNDGLKKYKDIVTTNIYIEKHRNGQTGTIQLLFDKSTGLYMDVSPSDPYKGK
ncbi:replicative DNA helicase [Ureaplasma ceti]|uniref:DNA 5'-3' helicase n=1 Tax=Ureaplasma ceti TaxID=3119530 RepID=A0ABP9UCD4_9BACT